MFAKNRSSIFAATILVLLVGQLAHAAAAEKIVFKNDSIEYTLTAEGKNASFLVRGRDRNQEYLAGPGQQAVVTLKTGGKSYSPTSCRFADGRLVAEFAEAHATITLSVRCAKRYIRFEIESVDGPAVEQVSLLNLVLKTDEANAMSGLASDAENAIVLRALNLQASGRAGGKPAWLSATASREHQFAGAKIGLTAAPVAEIRQVLKEMLESEGATRSPLGGPWALDAPRNRGSYVFANVTEKNVDEWIALAKLGGIQQIHFIGWEQTLGHYAPRKDAFPHGLDGLKATVAKVHAAGLKAGMHTLTGAIARGDRWASPVPDPRLAKDASFTLTESIDGKSTVLRTVEKPGDLDAVWAYSGRGNVLQLGDELIQYDAIGHTPPYGFTACHRGAFGTKAAPHAQGTPVHHLFVRYETFQPDENSSLVDELAAAIAEVYNTCGFDMIYQDGSEGMAGGEFGMARMREAIFKRLHGDVLVEASAWGHYEWAFHSRFGAWDYPNWGLKRFVDAHCRANADFRRTALLPAQLGWWVINGPDRDHPAETPDEFEYLCCKSLAYDTPTSFEGVSVGSEPANARQNEYLAMLGRYEKLRLSGRCPAALREKLKTEQADFHMVESPDGSVDFVPVEYLAHKVKTGAETSVAFRSAKERDFRGAKGDNPTVIDSPVLTGLADGSDAWTLNNRHAAQPLRVRIDALYSVEPYNAPDGRVLADFSTPGQFVVREAAQGVTASFGVVPSVVTLHVGNRPDPVGKPDGRYSAASTRGTPQGAWCRATKTFDPPLDLREFDALGVWIFGDGKGELLNLQLTNPEHFWPTFDEHYVKIDFRGWRYFELLCRERDAERYADYEWPYHDTSGVYRSPLIHDHVSALNLWYNCLPPGGKATCCLGPIKALRTVKTRLKNPAVTVGGKEIVFPVVLESGCSLEFADAECKVFDERGKLLQTVRMTGPTPQLAPGDNPITFHCEAAAGPPSRAKITVVASGKSVGRIAAGD